MTDIKAIGELNRRMRAQAEAERGIKQYLIEETIMKGSGTVQLFLLSAGPNSKPHGFRIVATPEAVGNYNPEPSVYDYVTNVNTQVGVNMFATALDDYYHNNDFGVEFKYHKGYL